MSDVFEDHPEVAEQRTRLWSLIEQTPALDWLLLTKRPENIRAMVPRGWLEEPQQNVWFGTSVEDQRRASERIPLLIDVPAAVHFLSCEPLLEALPALPLSGIEWLIVGGESGPGARAMQAAWAFDLRLQCQKAGVAFFFKQTGTALATVLGISGKGGHDLAGVPRTLRVREFPAVGTTNKGAQSRVKLAS